MKGAAHLASWAAPLVNVVFQAIDRRISEEITDPLAPPAWRVLLLRS